MPAGNYHRPPMVGSPTELAWIAGFIEADGSIFVNRGRKRFYVQMKVVQAVPELIARVAQVTGNAVEGPYNPPSSSHQKFYATSVSGSRAEELMKLLWPYLTEDAKNKYQQALDVVKERNGD